MAGLNETAAAGRVQLAYFRGIDMSAMLAQYGLEFPDVLDWSEIGVGLLQPVCDDPDAFSGRLAGIVGTAIILGIELERLGELPAPVDPSRN